MLKIRFPLARGHWRSCVSSIRSCVCMLGKLVKARSCIRLPRNAASAAGAVRWSPTLFVDSLRWFSAYKNDTRQTVAVASVARFPCHHGPLRANSARVWRGGGTGGRRADRPHTSPTAPGPLRPGDFLAWACALEVDRRPWPALEHRSNTAAAPHPFHCACFAWGGAVPAWRRRALCRKLMLTSLVTCCRAGAAEGVVFAWRSLHSCPTSRHTINSVWRKKKRDCAFGLLVHFLHPSRAKAAFGLLRLGLCSNRAFGGLRLVGPLSSVAINLKTPLWGQCGWPCSSPSSLSSSYSASLVASLDIESSPAKDVGFFSVSTGGLI